MQALAAVFPTVVVLTTLVLVFFAIRLNRRLSRGAKSAGARDVIPAEQVGLARTPWELTALHDQLRAGSLRSSRSDLVQTVNRLTAAAGMTGPQYTLTSNANDQMIANVVGMLEQRLELDPLEPTLGLPYQ